MGWKVLRKLFCMLGAHSSEDVCAARRRGGLAEAVMRNRSLRNRVVRR
jgi:hypothetical protein